MRLSWFYPVSSQFTITATNLNDTTARTIRVADIRAHEYVFVAPPGGGQAGSGCTAYRFRVTAPVSTSMPVSEVVGFVPSLPDVSPVVASLRHSLVLARSGISLDITYNVCMYDNIIK